ncbi:MAG TPA: MT-A70 family methyltransferase [Hyphomicrobiales bacterium]|nr:MT-A70 family methyltransferase [Hyphomicrobiales bacterium]
MTWPFGDLKPLYAQLIVADPPWAFQTFSERGHAKSAHAHYNCMSLEEIKVLPVSYLASGDCLLFLWAIFPMLPQAFEVMSAWGFVYKSGGVWHKRTKNGRTAFGVGYRLRSAAEPWLIGTIGNPSTSRAHRNIIEGEVREHSRKPEEAYRWLESYMPGARRVELFSRQNRPGWLSWGAETGKFDEAVS